MLTNTQARDAKPRATRYEITCDALPGFILRVLPTGKKVLFVRFRDRNGKDQRRRLGLLGPELSLDEARKLALRIIAHRGDDPSEPAPPAPVIAPLLPLVPAARPGPNPLTVREFSCRFEQEHIDMYLKPRTAHKYRTILRTYILPAFGDQPLEAVTAADVQRLHNRLHAVPCAANYVRCVLSVMFSKAQHWGVIANNARNPATVVRRFRERAVERFLSPEERRALDRVLTAAEGFPRGAKGYIGKDAIWAIRLLLLTGMRRDEVRDLCWEYIDWRQGTLRLPDSKTGKRDIIVSDQVIALLKKISAAKGNPRQGLVVSSLNGLKLHSLDRSWQKVRRLAGIEDVRLHDLRHSVASDAIMNGVPLEVVGKMLGHRNYRTTQRYAHIADNVLRDAVNLTSETIVRASRSGTSGPRKRPGGR